MKKNPLLWSAAIVTLVVFAAAVYIYISKGEGTTQSTPGANITPPATTPDPSASDDDGAAADQPSRSDAGHAGDGSRRPDPDADDPKMPTPSSRDAGSDEAPTAGPDAGPDALAGANANGTPDADDSPRGVLDKDTIRAAIGEMKPAVAKCYQETLKDFPDADGRIVLGFEIIGAEGKGHVDMEEIKEEESELYEEELNRCLIDALRNVEFPVPEGGGTVKVTYPFSFENKNDEKKDDRDTP